jgi:pimeloyl-ACP methyl ester carboxylesterase
MAVGHMANSEGYGKLLDEVAGNGDLIETNRARFGEVRCPVLILFGNQDRVLSPRGGPRIAETIPNCELRMLEGYGHAPMLDRPDDIAGMILERANS